MEALDAPGFEEWYAVERPRVLASLILIIGDIDMASESTDEAFVRALVHWGRVRAMASPGGWVMRVGVNTARRMARRAQRERELLARHRFDEVVSQPALEAWDLVRGLPSRQREAVVLRYVADLPEVEIARIMGVRRGTVSATLLAARRRMSEQWDPSPREAGHVRRDV
jgi:RNA polymerase sigma factor (sigma-70 family)